MMAGVAHIQAPLFLFGGGKTGSDHGFASYVVRSGDDASSSGNMAAT